MSTMSMIAALVGACCLLLAAPSTAATTRSYRAATVMHYPWNVSLPSDTRTAALKIVVANLRRYEELIASAKSDGADVIVFPETGTGYLFVPDKNLHNFCEPVGPAGWIATSCDTPYAVANGNTSSHRLHSVWASCMARKYGIDMVVNMCHRDDFAAPSNGSNNPALYNSNAAFTAAGYFVAVYHKSHINAVPTLTQPATPDPVAFVSSFGVTFGLFICYDLWFPRPIENLIAGGVRDFLYPNGMSSIPPMAAMDHIHLGFSRRHDANLVSSTIYPAGGAGVFSRGELRRTLSYYPQAPLGTISAVAVAELPRLEAPAGSSSASVHPQSSSPLSPVRSGDAGAPCFTKIAPGGFRCDVFTPVPGRTVQLSAAIETPVGIVGCAASVTPATVGPNASTWVLAAAAIPLVPDSPKTPNEAVVAACVLMHCDTPTDGCPLGAPIPSNWAADMTVSAAELKVTYGGAFFSNPRAMNVYPLYGTRNPGSSIASVQTGGLPADRVVFKQDERSNTYSLKTSAGMEEQWPLFSFGFFTSAMGHSWNPQRHR